MGTGRTRAQVLVVGADGFISQRFITETLQLPYARYMADSWHLLNKNLADKDNFTRVNYNAIITNLKGMIDAESEHFFETHYTSAMNILIEKRASTKERNYLEAFEKKKDEYALYLIKKMPGSFLYHGSQASESNHSVIHAHLGRYYCEEAYRLMADLINIGMSRQSTKRKELLQQNNLLRCQKDTLMKNQCLGMVSGMMDIIRKGYASDSLKNLWRERHSLITASVPRNGEKSRPKDPEKALFSYANTQRAMKRPKSNLERIQNYSQQKIQSKGIRRCTFCNKEKCTVVNCPLKMSHGQVVVDISKFKMDIERSYPIAIHPFDSSMTALVRSTDISLTKGSNHIIVHSIHPMNVNSASINGIEQLVIKVSFVGSRKTGHPGQIIPQLGRVGIECHALFSFMDMIAGSANRFVFNAIENDGKGSDFIVRGTDYNVNRVHNGNFLHPNSQLISRHTEGQYVPQQYMSMGLNPYGFQGNHVFGRRTSPHVAHSQQHANFSNQKNNDTLPFMASNDHTQSRGNTDAERNGDNM